MASMRDIKRRKASIQSTGQITKAMKLVSTVKLQKSRQKAEGSKPYFDLMYETISSMLKKSGTIDHKYLRAGATDGKAVIAITSNRGLAGGYNNNIVKLIAGNEALTPEKTRVYAIGRKGRDGLAKKGYEIAEDYSEVIDEPAYRMRQISQKSCWPHSAVGRSVRSILHTLPLKTPWFIFRSSSGSFRLPWKRAARARLRKPKPS